MTAMEIKANVENKFKVYVSQKRKDIENELLRKNTYYKMYRE